MMAKKNLLLMRHAEAEPLRTEDEKRKLTPRGRKQALQQGKCIKAEGLEVDCIVSSSAVRALETAEGMKKGMELDRMEVYPHMVLYNALSQGTKFASFLSSPSSQTLLLVGHMPVVLRLANHVAGENLSSFPPCSLVWLEWLEPSWESFSANSALFKKFFSPPQGV